MIRFFWIFIGVIVAVVVIAIALNAIFLQRPYAYPPNGTYYPYGMMGWGFGGFWGFGALMMIIPVALLIFFIIWLVEAATRNGRQHEDIPVQGQAGKSALDILNERYANGSITSEEYARIKEEITKK
jgi:putative membrane protein